MEQGRERGQEGVGTEGAGRDGARKGKDKEGGEEWREDDGSRVDGKETQGARGVGREWEQGEGRRGGQRKMQGRGGCERAGLGRGLDKMGVEWWMGWGHREREEWGRSGSKGKGGGADRARCKGTGGCERGGVRARGGPEGLCRLFF